ncbi:helix-turn-helix domain-containing protein [Saccharopolyspora shandongensis]|uniref:winged helix-turn-helix transcriptional regulator n=1 Tax=Saccharopolyspora shandongensis TaxID=418495 RepID=UPI00343BD8C2
MIPSNILSARLKQLEEAGLVTRRALPHPERAVVYELTAYGRDLEPALIALGRWGARTMTAPHAGRRTRRPKRSTPAENGLPAGKVRCRLTEAASAS